MGLPDCLSMDCRLAVMEASAGCAAAGLAGGVRVADDVAEGLADGEGVGLAEVVADGKGGALVGRAVAGGGAVGAAEAASELLVT